MKAMKCKGVNFPCSQNSDCCMNRCSFGSCAYVVPTTTKAPTTTTKFVCKGQGEICDSNTDCCTNFCWSGFAGSGRCTQKFTRG